MEGHLLVQQNRSADEAIRVLISTLEAKVNGHMQHDREHGTFFKRMKPHTAKPPIMHIPLTPALIALSRRLGTGFHIEADAALYDRFVGAYSGKLRNRSSNHRYALNMARLSLSHPTRPDPTLVLKFVRDSYASENASVEAALEYTMRDTLHRTRQLLQKTGRLADAEFIAGKQAQLFPEEAKSKLSRRNRERRQLLAFPARPMDKAAPDATIWRPTS